MRIDIDNKNGNFPFGSEWDGIIEQWFDCESAVNRVYNLGILFIRQESLKDFIEKIDIICASEYKVDLQVFHPLRFSDMPIYF